MTSFWNKICFRPIQGKHVVLEVIARTGWDKNDCDNGDSCLTDTKWGLKQRVGSSQKISRIWQNQFGDWVLKARQ